MAWIRCMGGNTAKLAGTDKVPYLNRAIPFSANLEKDKLVGGTIAFNQLVKIGVIHVEKSTAVSWNTFTSSSFNFSLISGHKYLVMLNGTVVVGGQIGVRDEVASIAYRPNTGYMLIYLATQSTNNTTYIQGNWAEGTTNAYLNIIDLTAMFGSTIADYIYSLEQATAGAGVAFFRNLFPNDYYAYNAGELMSVKTSAHKTYDSNNVLIGEYPLDSNLELRGIPKLDSNNKLYYDGDTYESNGSVTRNFNYRAYQSGDVSDFVDMITDGTHTIERLVTTTTETADSFINPQAIEAGGTEEYVDSRSVAIPVGHESKYYDVVFPE